MNLIFYVHTSYHNDCPYAIQLLDYVASAVHGNSAGLDSFRANIKKKFPVWMRNIRANAETLLQVLAEVKSQYPNESLSVLIRRPKPWRAFQVLFAKVPTTPQDVEVYLRWIHLAIQNRAEHQQQQGDWLFNGLRQSVEFGMDSELHSV